MKFAMGSNDPQFGRIWNQKSPTFLKDLSDDVDVLLATSFSVQFILGQVYWPKQFCG